MKKIVDVRNKPCPEPVILTKKAIETEDFNELEIITNSEVSKENIERFLITKGIKFEVTKIGENYHLLIKKMNVSTYTSKKELQLKLIVTKNYFGEGDKKLGEILIKTFFHTLNDSEKLPETIFFVNSGVHLTIFNSPVLDELKNLECKGVEILSCGTCLDYFNIKDKLAVGKIGNMYKLIEMIENNGVII
ncbi:MAG: sulfurtransferase-like selenium metabolism protein YedF [Proteobacteria bacterium]|nr:sulfurtransferase-like selenium metabolism protein YedF [Pseudomonadota bacterium]